MKSLFSRIFSASLLLVSFVLLMLSSPAVSSAETPLISSVKELNAALANAKNGETILVGDIAFQPMPAGMIVLHKNITIKSGKETNAVFSNATFAFNGTTTEANALNVRFESIDFRGDGTGSPFNVSSQIPDLMKTMCAGIFKMNVNATYENCSFENYHYGYGGVFNAIYSADDDPYALKLTLNGCSFSNNAANYGGCLYMDGFSHNVTLDAHHCVFEKNTASTGGAIWAKNASVRLLDCSFLGNSYLERETQAPNGGALALYNSDADLNGCLIADNIAGNDGGGVFCEISPFRTLTMENCTIIGNKAKNDEGICFVPSETKYDTQASAHIYFSSFFGTQRFSENDERFGCLFVGLNDSEQNPSAENHYCLQTSFDRAKQNGWIPKDAQHVNLPDGTTSIPKEEIEKIAGGKFGSNLATLQVGDNFKEKISIQINKKPGSTESVSLSYGDTLHLSQPERKGFSFKAWKNSAGEVITEEIIFLGGNLPDGKITTHWQFDLSKNLYLVWILLGVFLLVFCFILLKIKKKSRTDALPTAVETTEEPPVLSSDWIARVCEKNDLNEQLSKREMEVLRELLEGKGRKQIAEDLFVTEATIRKHSTSIYSKLNVHNRTELIYKLTKQ